VKVAPTITLDGRLVPLTEVGTPALHPVLRKQNVFGAPAGTYLSVAHGWVALLDPLTSGTHTITIVIGGNTVNTTTIVVKGH
jgi:hypothetical protein